MEQKKARAKRAVKPKGSTVPVKEQLEQNAVIPNKVGVLPARLLGKSRWWIFTDYNVTKDNGTEKMEQYKLWMIEKGGNIYMNPEVCPTTDRFHIQGCLEFINPREIKVFLDKWGWDIHVEKTKKAIAAKLYCQKEETRAAGMEPVALERGKLKDIFDSPDVKILPFQKEILDILNTEPDDRTIRWYYGEDGKMGKTKFAKHILIKHRSSALYLSGEVKDITFAVAQYVIAHGETALIVCLFDFPRTMEHKISYEALEKVKDGILFSGKYESGHVLFNSPHIICLANCEPKIENLSKDRWIITNIETGERKTFKKKGRMDWETVIEKDIYKPVEEKVGSVEKTFKLINVLEDDVDNIADDEDIKMIPQKDWNRYMHERANSFGDIPFDLDI